MLVPKKNTTTTIIYEEFRALKGTEEHQHSNKRERQRQRQRRTEENCLQQSSLANSDTHPTRQRPRTKKEDRSAHFSFIQ